MRTVSVGVGCHPPICKFRAQFLVSATLAHRNIGSVALRDPPAHQPPRPLLTI